MIARPRLRTVLLLVHLAILALPIAGISMLRLYDSMLIRQTESELLVQGAALAAMYERQLQQHADASGRDLSSYGRPVRPGLEDDPEHRFRPALPELDIARSPVLPPALLGHENDVTVADRVAATDADEMALQAGSEITEVLAEIKKVTLAGLRIVAPDGVVVASSGAELGDPLLHRSEVAQALQGENVSLLRRRETNQPTPPLGSISRGTLLRVVVAFPVISGDRVWGAVVAARTPLSVRQALYRDRHYFVLGGVFLLAAVGIISWLTARTLSRPIRALIAQTQRVRRGERGVAQPLEHPGTHEIAQVSEAIADMARDLEERAAYIETFATNVSHEFKTPLTSIRGTVELLRDHLSHMDPEQLDRFLSILEKDSQRLELLVGRLLELARADVLKPSDETCQLGVVFEILHDRFPAVDFDTPGPLTVAMAPDIVESIVGNLIDNARIHGGPEINVRVRAAQRGGRVGIEVRDDGAGISPANLAKVFDRFFTTRRKEGGSGLGLAIAKALAEAHGGSLTVSSKLGHTVFKLELPA